MMYGTAWKEERTAPLTEAALRAGFRAIDTANQRRHYFEEAVGEAIRAGLDAGVVRRDELFLQTKFTYANGQDHRLPYDPKASVSRQVEQSFASSLDHLGVDRIEAYLLHGPSTYPGLGKADWEAWAAMEELQRSGATRLLGVSNVTIDQLRELHEKASVRPAMVQNRTFTRPAADAAVRGFCSENGLAYEGFSLLTANRFLLVQPVVRAVMARTGMTAPQVVFRHALGRGIHVLTGTTSTEHMAQDLGAYAFDLEPDEVSALDALVA